MVAQVPLFACNEELVEVFDAYPFIILFSLSSRA